MKFKIALALAALTVAGAAFAQPPAGGGQTPSPEMQAARQAMIQACAADMKSNCDGKQGREMMICMRDAGDKVSAPCKDAMAKMMAARRAAAPQ